MNKEEEQKQEPEIIKATDLNVINDIMNSKELNTTFFQDFTIAEAYGVRGVEDTFNRAFEEWKDNYIYLTELTMVLNWKLWIHHEHGNMELAKVYDRLWKKADLYAVDNLKGKELTYFYNETD